MQSAETVLPPSLRLFIINVRSVGTDADPCLSACPAMHDVEVADQSLSVIIVQIDLLLGGRAGFPEAVLSDCSDPWLRALASGLLA